MRYLHLFLLRSQEIFTQRSKSFIFFLKALLNPFFMLFFWKGVGRTEVFFNHSFIISYYLFAVVAYALLMSSIEDDVATNDIEFGGLSQYLIKPFSYYWMKFIEELPYRLLQGLFGISVCILLQVFFKNLFQFTTSPQKLFLTMIIFILAYFLSFTFKMLIGIVTFWIDDPQAMYHLMDAVILVFSGLVVPLQFMPGGLKSVAEFLPFSYMVYYPATAIIGIFSEGVLLRIITIQTLWLVAFYVFFTFSWNKGIKKYTGVGQ